MNVVTAGLTLTKISNKNLAETRNCEVGLAPAPRTFTAYNVRWLQSLEKCGIPRDHHQS
jgi:hypothetical protein